MNVRDYIWTDPQRCSGQPCFKNTRIPVWILYDYLEDGQSVSDFLAAYPDLDRDMVYGLLKAQREAVDALAA